MGYKRFIRFTCDVCGKSKKMRDNYNSTLPPKWSDLRFDGGYFVFCDDCTNTTQLFAFKLAPASPKGRRTANEEVWLVGDADLKALAEGVPAEDIFV